MRWILCLFIFILTNCMCRGQANYFGPTQVGNNNIQNISGTPTLKFTEDMGYGFLKLLRSAELDSNFHHTKYLDIYCMTGANSATIISEVKDFFLRHGFTCKSPNCAISWWIGSSEVINNITIALSPKDSLVSITFGEVDLSLLQKSK